MVSKTAVKIAYRPVGLILGAAAGLLAGALFKQVWKMVEGDTRAPKASDEHRRWAEVLAAAAIQGAIFALVKAAVDRAGAAGTRRLTGQWPG